MVAPVVFVSRWSKVPIAASLSLPSLSCLTIVSSVSSGFRFLFLNLLQIDGIKVNRSLPPCPLLLLATLLHLILCALVSFLHFVRTSLRCRSLVRDVWFSFFGGGLVDCEVISTNKQANHPPGNFTFENYDRTAATAGAGSLRSDQTVDMSEQSTIMVAENEKTENSSERGESRDEVDEEEEKRNEEVLQLARRYTTQSHNSVYHKNPFEEGEDSVLNPASPNFKPHAFAKSLLNLQARDPEKWKTRTAGFAYKNLSVYGFGSATDYQKSVGNVVLEVVGLAKKLLRMDNPRKIDILQNLDGVVHSGEMLVVLGPPGS